MKRILIVAAHPDDEILGCGGTISKYRQKNCEIKVLFLGEGSTCRFEDSKSIEAQDAIKRRNECAVFALKTLNVDNFEFYNLPCGKLDQIPLLSINKIIEKTINEFKPDTVFTHAGVDSNNDHQIVLKSTIIATRPCSNHIVNRVFSYEILSSSEWGFTQAFEPNYFIGFSKFNLEQKWEAMNCYKTEVGQFPFPRSKKTIFSLAELRGSQAGMEYCEAFQLVREFEK